MEGKNIQISICIPAYNRPAGLRRALKSIIDQQGIDIDAIEIIISDDSTVPTCKQITTEILENWPGQWKYMNNSPRLGMAENWNHSIKKASGEYVLILHDDDYLEEKGINAIFQGIQKSKREKKVLLFGVNIVNSDQKILRNQSFKQVEYLSPQKAIEAVLSNSSFVRFPGIVISKNIFTTDAYFDNTIGGVADLEMWTRLFMKYGLWCMPDTTAAYTVHSNALTMSMFNSDSILKIEHIFNKIESSKIHLSESEINQLKSNFFHQFILAGTFRNLRRSQWKEAQEIMSLFKHKNIIKLPISYKWYLTKIVFSIIIFTQFFLSGRQL